MFAKHNGAFDTVIEPLTIEYTEESAGWPAAVPAKEAYTV